MTRLPDFLIIGAMKAATSSLHDQLAATPGIFMSSPKELYFFSDDPVYAKGLPWYASHFTGAAPNDICGESTTHYAKLPTYPDTIPRIKQHLPDAKFVYVMRHPIDRLVSQYTHMWLENELTATFTDAVDGAVPELTDYSRYSTQLRPYFETFGAAAVLPVFVDRLRAHPDTELDRIAKHIGFDGPVAWNNGLAANNVSTERLKQSRLRDTIKQIPGYEMARDLVPEAAIERLRDRWRPSGKPELTDAQRSRLANTFDADLATLGSWLGADLSCANLREVTAARSFEWLPTVLSDFKAPADQ